MFFLARSNQPKVLRVYPPDWSKMFDSEFLVIHSAEGRKKIAVFHYNSLRKLRYLVLKTLVSVEGMRDSDGDGGSSFGSVETVTDAEQEANAAALHLDEKRRERRKKKQLEFEKLPIDHAIGNRSLSRHRM